MIVLHTFGKQHDMIDPSPFVAKAHALLRFAGLPYEAVPADVRKAPRGKLPVLIDDGETIADSTFIRFHIEKKYGHDFDAGLDARARHLVVARKDARKPSRLDMDARALDAAR